jgi:DNA-binding NarL/FixJ family response regulator
MSALATILVLLVDDHALVRSGLRRLLEDDPAIAVVGEASDGDAAVRMAQSLKPHVVLMDYALAGMNGLTATHRILERLPDVAILMLSMYGEEVLVRRAATS